MERVRPPRPTTVGSTARAVRYAAPDPCAGSRFAVTALGAPRALVQIPGIKLVDGLKAQLTAIAASQGMTLEEMRKRMIARPDPAAADGAASPPMRMPSPLAMRAILWYARARQHAYNWGVFVYNVTIGIFRGYLDYVQPAPALDAGRILTTLSMVNAHGVFVRAARQATVPTGGRAR